MAATVSDFTDVRLTLTLRTDDVLKDDVLKDDVLKDDVREDSARTDSVRTATDYVPTDHDGGALDADRHNDLPHR